MDVNVEPVRWETHSTPGLQGRPQGMINEELIPKSDMLIAIFRCRAGSPTGVDVSGTIEEIRECMAQGKYVVVYFYEGEVDLPSVDPDQLRTIREFKEEIQRQGLTDSYRTVDELCFKLSHHLTGIIGRLLNAAPATAELDAQAPPPPLPQSTGDSTSPVGDATELVVNDSGRWTLIDTNFYEAESVRQTAEGSWILEIRSADAEQDSQFASLRPHHFGRSRPIAFAHRNDGFLVTVGSVESVSQGNEQIWTLTLVPEDVEYGGSMMDCVWQSEGSTYTPDDFARLRAGRILLNDPAPYSDEGRQFSPQQMHEAMLESFIRGTDSPAPVKHCIVRAIHEREGSDPERFLRIARLASIYFLKAGNAVEAVLNLTLGPIRDGNVHVQFRGRRRRVASNVEPTVIELEGDCPLE